MTEETLKRAKEIDYSLDIFKAMKELCIAE